MTRTMIVDEDGIVVMSMYMKDIKALLRVVRAAKEYKRQATQHCEQYIPLEHSDIHFGLIEALKEVEYLL